MEVSHGGGGLFLFALWFRRLETWMSLVCVSRKGVFSGRDVRVQSAVQNSRFFSEVEAVFFSSIFLLCQRFSV